MSEKCAGLFLQDETLEVVPGDVYERCHFSNVKIVGVGLVIFRDCSFRGPIDLYVYSVTFEENVFERGEHGPCIRYRPAGHPDIDVQIG